MAANQAEDWKKAFTPASLREPESRSRVRSMNRAEGLASRKEKARRAKPVKGEQRLPPREEQQKAAAPEGPAPGAQGGIEHCLAAGFPVWAGPAPQAGDHPACGHIEGHQQEDIPGKEGAAVRAVGQAGQPQPSSPKGRG